MRRTRRSSQRGFALLAVVILLVVMTAAAALTLDEAVESIQNSGRVRASEMIKSGLDHGLNAAMARLQNEDPATLADPANDWDLFGQPVMSGMGEFLGPFSYPDTGPYRDQFRVRVGLRPGQRTRAPAGEDVRQAYGQIVELQVGVEATGNGVSPSEERVSIGVLLPRRRAQAN